MTDRAEIERLLQMTSRTLEGLPEHHNDVEIHNRIKELIGVWGLYAGMPELGEHILHQSDVIEVLVGALRDALTERDSAILDLKAISHCYTCSNQDLDDNWVCKNSGGGGAPFMNCPGYVWDKKVPEPPKEGTHETE